MWEYCNNRLFKKALSIVVFHLEISKRCSDGKKMLIVVCYIAKRDSIILIFTLLKHENCAVLEVFLRLQSKLSIYLPYHCNKFAIFYMCICMCIYIIYRNKKEKRENIKVEKAKPSHTLKNSSVFRHNKSWSHGVFIIDWSLH